jgi:hypothetical protein
MYQIDKLSQSNKKITIANLINNNANNNWAVTAAYTF